MARRRSEVGFILALTILFSLGILSVSDSLEDVPATQQQLSLEAYDYFHMVLQWPPSLCSNLSVQCAIPYEKRFIIRRFRPLPRRSPCSGPPFHVAKIEYIRAKLSKVWYDLVYGKDENVWKEAWERDGVCSANRFDQTDYFELALNIKNNKEYSVLDIVQSVGITPMESNPLWRRDRFFNAIYWRLGREPILQCNTNKYTKKPQLVAVVLCFARDGIRLINCPRAGNCPEYFTWPTTANPPPPPPPPPPANFRSVPVEEE